MIRSIAALLVACAAMSANAQEGYTLATDDEAAVSAQDLRATRDIGIEHATGVTTISYSSDSENFYFWLDEFVSSSGNSGCTDADKFGIHVTAANVPLIDQVKMAFLSGKQVRVFWNTGACTGGGMRPHYIKIYR